jgi:outer membrane protein TolC
MKRGLEFLRRAVAIGLCYSCSISLVVAQQVAIAPVKPTSPIFLRPYQAPTVPPIRLANSTRLGSLIRAGKLYLTAQDAIALALENNIDIEVSRYDPIHEQWKLQRYQAGGALPGVPSSSSQVNTVTSGQGVAGSQAAAGVSAGNNNNTGNGTQNAQIVQIGPVTPTLDPVFQQTSVFGHQTAPQNVQQAGVPILFQSKRNYSASLQTGYLLGGSVTLSYSNAYLNENALTDVLNPSLSMSLSLSIQQNLLQGFGTAVNARTINVERIALGTTELNFRTQVISIVSNVLNYYYALIADYQDVTAKKSAVEVAQKFYEDNQKQVKIGTMAPLDVTTAEAQVATTQQDLVVSQTTLAQQEVQLKDALSRRGVADPLLANVQIIPLDSIVVPEKDDLPPVKELVQQALVKRSDLEAARRSIESAKIAALGTQNGVRPGLALVAGTTQRGLAGTPKTVIDNGQIETADPYFVGGVGNALGQVFRRNFPTNRVGEFFQAPLRNRVAQADEGIEQLQLRQNEVGTQKTLNQVAVDVSNQVVQLRQARARYEAAVRTRILNQQLLDAEQKKFALGASTPYAVVTQQRDLATAQSAEVSSLVSYSSAKIALDQTVGTTLETNHVSIGDAMAGRVGRASSLPSTLPTQP